MIERAASARPGKAQPRDRIGGERADDDREQRHADRHDRAVVDEARKIPGEERVAIVGERRPSTG